MPGDSRVSFEESLYRSTETGRIDIGGVEYLVGRADGQIYFYDINATSNFVANAPAVLGFDPFPRFVDYIVRVATGGAGRVSTSSSATRGS